MPGAGGIAAANHIDAIAPKDGTVIAAIQNTVPFEPFYGNKAALFDATKLNWLGTPTTEVGMYIVWHASKIKSLRDAQTTEMIAGGAGAASTPAFDGRIFNQILQLKARLVTGYPGQNEILLAMENGEVEAMPSPFWSSLKVQRPKWLPEGTIRVLFQYGAAPHPELKGVPFARDLLSNEADKILLTAAVASLGLGRPYAAPPGLPAERLAALREAMMATFNDPQFLADCERQRLECVDHHTGSDLEAQIKQAYGIPDDIRKRLVAIQQQGRAEEKK
jgi:tripartite-type tricarboxylate transporter receptor subunit TctC